MQIGAQKARAGHEFAYYPSFYPHEIRLEVAQSVGSTPAGGLHAVVGGSVATALPMPAPRFVESLRSLVAVALEGPDRGRPRAERCALIDRAVSQARSSKTAVFHPYPITPYHADYLLHFDRIQAARRRHARQDRVEAANADKASPGARATVMMREVALDDLIDTAALPFTGWPQSPEVKKGWFQAYQILSPFIQDRILRNQATALYQRLMRGAYQDPAERIDLERRLVALLLAECRAAVAGYSLRREVVSDDFSGGIENVTYDAHTGLNSALFLRTVKLKDFPWNGRLNIAVDANPGAAWNPVAGFGDPFGRLLWAAVADPAFLPHPYDADWIPNRVTWGVPEPSLRERAAGLLRRGLGRGGGIAVPADAVLPDDRGISFRSVGRGQRAAVRIRYRILTSAFHDGTPVDVADLLYPYLFLHRWGRGDGTGAGEGEFDRSMGAAGERLRGALAGVRIVAIEREIKNLGDRQLIWQVPVVDVYLRGVADPGRSVIIAPPWSTVPWHVLALMEEAARRGIGVFSRDESRGRGLPWLDLVRGEGGRELAGLVDQFAADAYIPPGLEGRVTPAEARRRWVALLTFYAMRRHFLVTNGPYRLDRWTSTSIILSAFRHPSYPLVIGTFDRFAVPRRAYITGSVRRGDSLEITADVERLMKFGRTYEIAREPLRQEILTGLQPVRPACRYAVLDAEGTVLEAGDAVYDGDRLFTVRLPRQATRVLVAAYVDENYVAPEVRILDIR